MHILLLLFWPYGCTANYAACASSEVISVHPELSLAAVAKPRWVCRRDRKISRPFTNFDTPELRFLFALAAFPGIVRRRSNRRTKAQRTSDHRRQFASPVILCQSPSLRGCSAEVNRRGQ